MTIDTNKYFINLHSESSKREKTYFKLIDAAIELIYEKGFHLSSVKEICEISGVANGTFYNHFLDKEDIYSQAALNISRPIATFLNQKKAEAPNAVEVVKTGHVEYINYLALRPKWAVVILQTQRGSYGTDVWNLNKRRVTADVKRGIKEGVFNIKFDPFLIDQIMQLVLHSITQQVIYSPSKAITVKTSIAIMRLLKYEES